MNTDFQDFQLRNKPVVITGISYIIEKPDPFILVHDRFAREIPGIHKFFFFVVSVSINSDKAFSAADSFNLL